MKKLITLMLITILVTGLTACGNQQTEATTNTTDNEPTGVIESTGESKILIVYFSVPEAVDATGVAAVAGASIVVSEGEKLGNTEYVAKVLQETTGGDLFRIETADDYPLDHEPLVAQAADEQDQNFRPQLTGQIDDFEQYDTILLGFPNWWADMPMPIYSFLESYDFSGKTIIPFITHGGSGASKTLNSISEIQPGASIREDALVLSRNDVGSSKDEIVKWADGLNLTP